MLLCLSVLAVIILLAHLLWLITLKNLWQAAPVIVVVTDIFPRQKLAAYARQIEPAARVYVCQITKNLNPFFHVGQFE